MNRQGIIARSFILAAVLLLVGIVFVPISQLPSGVMESQWLWAGGTCMAGSICLLTGFIAGRRTGIDRFLSDAVVWAFLVAGGAEAILSLLQLFGVIPSGHSLYSFTGAFYNPGPYCGYLAMVFPMSLEKILHYRSIPTRTWKDNACYGLASAVCLLLACMLLAGVSRAAWCAAIVSGLWIYYHSRDRARLQVKEFFRTQRALKTSIISTFLLIAGLAVFMLKKDSALGRFFIWKISGMAIAESPWTGHGHDRFGEAYGLAQEAYFADGGYAGWEERVAGCPASAFNEYLQIAVEYGIPILIIVLAGITFCFYQGYRRKRLPACSGLLSLAVFSLFSYPMEIPIFAVSLFLLSIACALGTKWKAWLFSLSICGLSGVFLLKGNTYQACCQWNDCRMRYKLGAYNGAKEGYEKLYPELNNQAMFLFEYGHCLHFLGEYEESIRILKEAGQYSCDPMILNIIGKNYQQMKAYQSAEKSFIRSVHRLPGRIYPYYLLARLYAEPEFRHPEKFEEMADSVLHKKPKVDSKAIEEMRKAVKHLSRKETGTLPANKSIKKTD